MDGLFNADIVFGKSCGLTGDLNIYKFLADDLIANEDVWILKDWLTSSTTELQLYAVYGLKTLEKKGLKIDNATKKQIRFVRHKTGKIHHCKGCFVSFKNLKFVSIMAIK